MVEYPKFNAVLLDCVEVASKIKGNYYGFILAEIRLNDRKHVFLLPKCALFRIRIC